MYTEKEVVVDHSFNYSNIIPTPEGIAFLAHYCEELYTQFNILVNQNMQKNEMYHPDQRVYEYYKHFKCEFTITLKQKGLNNIICKSYKAFMEAVNSGKANNLNGLDVIMDLSYKRGSGNDLKDYRNDFKVIFRPYDIVFYRKSNHDEDNMNQIENSINSIMQQFPVANSIFCTK